MASLIGQQIGNYAIKSLIGQGGAASVYRTEQVTTGRTVALRVIQPQQADSETFKAQFEREVDVLKRLNHPHILPIYDYGFEADFAYMVTPLAEGGNLQGYIDANSPIPPETAARFLNQIADGLDYLHGQGVIHRDLKPANVLLDTNENVLIADFGIARLIAEPESDELTKTGTVSGTPTYLTPEQWRGAEADARSDLYQVGLIAYTLLTGRLAFEGETPFAILQQHLSGPVPSARAVRPELGVEIDQVLTKALAKDPAERFPSAMTLAKSFVAALPTPKLDHQTLEAATTVIQPPAKSVTSVPLPPPAPAMAPQSTRPAAPTAPTAGPYRSANAEYYPPPVAFPAQGGAKGRSPALLLVIIGVAVFGVVLFIGLIASSAGLRDYVGIVTLLVIGTAAFIGTSVLRSRAAAQPAYAPPTKRRPLPIPEPIDPRRTTAVLEQPKAAPPIVRAREPEPAKPTAPILPALVNLPISSSKRLSLFDFEEGQTFAGNYELRKRLDKGENSRVYHAWDQKRRRDVAIKLLSPSSDPKRQRRFEQEAELLGKLHHPHIVAFYDYDTFDGVSYLVMPLLNGGTLRDHVQENLPPLPQVADIIAQLTGALDYIHEQGIVHRDLKSSNVLLDSRDQAYLSDFGIAKVLNPHENLNLTVVGMPIGTALYMAPEQWMGVGVTASSDQYSLGVLAYQMLTGALPIEAPNLFKAAYEKPRPLQEMRSELPRLLEPVLQRVLSKRPEDRFPSVKDFSEALRGAVEAKAEMIISTPVTFTPPHTRPDPNNQTPEKGETRHVFISYSSNDGTYSDTLADYFLEKGFNVWIARQINYGADFWETIMKAIQGCGAFVLVMTPDGEKSQWVQREIDCAERYNKPILTLLREGENFALFWRRHYVDVKDGRMPPADFLTALAVHAPRGEGRGLAVRL